MDPKCEEAWQKYIAEKPAGAMSPARQDSSAVVWTRAWTAALDVVRHTELGDQLRRNTPNVEHWVAFAELRDLLYPQPPVPLCASCSGLPAVVVVRDDLEHVDYKLIVRPLGHVPFFNQVMYKPICGGCLKARVVRFAQEAAGKEER